MIIYYVKEGKSTCTYINDVPFNKLHRLDGPAMTYPNGIKEWWLDGKRHRLGGPAIIYPSGIKKWYKEGKLHRLDGAAVIWFDEEEEWWINDKELDTQDVEDWIKNNNINLKTKAHQVLFMVMFG